MERINVRRVTGLGVLFAASMLVVLLGAHVTPRGYRGHVQNRINPAGQVYGEHVSGKQRPRGPLAG